MTALKDKSTGKNMQICCLAESCKFFVVEASEHSVGVLHREIDHFLIQFWQFVDVHQVSFGSCATGTLCVCRRPDWTASPPKTVSDRQL